MSQLHKNTFRFLKNLDANNERDWFKAHKSEYDEIRADLQAFVEALITRIAGFDPDVSGLDPKKCIMRIYRDVRFSKDKTPYNVHLSAHIVAGGRSNEHGRAGYYVRLEPGKSILAGGAHLPPGLWIKRIRAEIAENANDLREIVGSKSFKKYFGEIEGDKLKTAPKGYPKDHPEIELLRFKSYLAVHNVTNKQVLSPDFLDYTMTVFEALHPFDAFLNR